MEAVVDRSEPGLEDVCVDLSCGKIRMAKHELNGPQVGPAFEQMGRKRMPDYVRAQRPGEIRAAAVPF